MELPFQGVRQTINKIKRVWSIKLGRIGEKHGTRAAALGGVVRE